MKDAKFVIWTSDINLEDWIDEDGNQMSYEDALMDNYDLCFSDAKENLYMPSNEIICIADVGRWNGRYEGYKLLGGNVSNILQSFCDGDCEWYYDGKDIRGNEAHHDSTNYYLYRELKGNTRDDQIENAEKLFSKPLNNRRIAYYTKPLGHVVRNIYGWK